MELGTPPVRQPRAANGLSGWLGRLPIQDELHRRNAVTLQVFSILIAIGAAIIETGRLASGFTFRSPAPSLFNALELLLALWAVVSLRRGRYERGVFLFVGALSLVFAARISLGGVAANRDVLKNIAIPLSLAALLLGRRALWATLAVFVVALAPQMNGRELADQVAAQRPGTPVIFLSGYAEDVIASRGLLRKGVVLVRKPYLPAELAAALDATG